MLKISLNGKVKSYPVFFGQSPNPNWQNYALTYDAYYTAGGEATLSVDAYKSKIKVIKIDNETKKSIEGVEFNFRYSDGQNIGNYKTNAQGCIELNKLRQGKVIATEIATKSEYILDDKENEILFTPLLSSPFALAAEIAGTKAVAKATLNDNGKLVNVSTFPLKIPY